MDINAKTDIYCIFGNPVRHSLSPAMHNLAFEKFNINAKYVAFEPDNIESAVSAMRTLGILGASITIPFKVDVMECIDKIDPMAKDIGSVNTLKNIDGKIHGYNTDGLGAVKALTEAGKKIKNLSILILGNGGGARAIAFSMLHFGANVMVAGRNLNKVKKLTSDLEKRYSGVSPFLISKLSSEIMGKIDVIINTTPLGMYPKEGMSPLKSELLTKKHTVFDIIYSPEMTKLLLDAKQAGAKIVKGGDMLVNQGVEQFRIWTGKKVSTNLFHKAIK